MEDVRGPPATGPNVGRVQEQVARLSARIEEMQMRLRALDEEGDVDGTEWHEFESTKAERKRALYKQIHAAVQSQEDATRGSKIIVKFPRHVSLDGEFVLELTGSGLTWNTVRDRACVMFGKSPEETLVVELKNNQRALVPLWSELAPGTILSAELVPKPFVPPKVTRLRSKEGSSSRLAMRHSASSLQLDSSMQQFAPQALRDDISPPDPIKLRREVVFDFCLYIAIFLLLAVGLVDPTSATQISRWFELLLQQPAKAGFVVNRGGEPALVTFNANVSTMDEAWAWVEGPLTSFLLGNLNQSVPNSGLGDQSWWGITPADTCPSEDNSATAPPLCTTRDFSIPSTPPRPRWLTSAISTEVVGAVRLRQFRARSSHCEIGITASARLGIPECFAGYSMASRSTLSYGPAECGFDWSSEKELSQDRPGAPTIHGLLATYDPSGFALDIVEANRWLPALGYLRNYTWLDPATRALIVEFTAGSPNSGLLASVRALIEKDPIGTVRTRFDAKALEVYVSGCSGHCQLRFITDIVVLVLAALLFVRVIRGGFFLVRRNRIGRTFDLCFVILYVASFIVDMILLSDLQSWQYTLVEPVVQYVSIDNLHLFYRVATRFRSALIVLLVIRFLIQGTMSLSRLTTVVFSRLMCVYVFVLILLIPFICSLALVAMILEQGTPLQAVRFGNALRNIFLVVTGVANRLTAATPHVGRSTGWSTVFYLFLVAVTYVLVIPTLVALAVIVYEHTLNSRSKSKSATEQSDDVSVTRLRSDSSSSNLLPRSKTQFERDARPSYLNKGAFQFILEWWYDAGQKVVGLIRPRTRTWRRRPEEEQDINQVNGSVVHA